MLLLDGCQEFLYDFRMLCRYIMVFVDIRCQVVETWLALYHYHLPVALSHANLVGLVELPVEVVVVLLFGILAQKGRSDGDSVETITCQLLVGVALGEVLDSGKVAEGWHQVVEGKLGVVYAARLDMLRPPGDERDADSALVTLALQALQLAVATEELWISAALLVRTVVRGKDHHGVLVETLLF